MSAPAVIKAVFTDYRRVKGRKVHQIVFEVASETWPAAYKVLGEPSIETSDWWAIARLTSEPQAKPKAESPKERQKFSRLRPSAQAALLCAKPAFWKFLDETIPGVDVVQSEEQAARVVRYACQVESRSDFDHDEAAAQMWFALRDRFEAWVAAGE